MASTLDFVEYTCGQMRNAGDITYRKMFGEYAIYCNEKCFGLVCDNQVFINPTQAGLALFESPIMGIPYAGAKPRILLEELDDTDFVTTLVVATYNELPPPKPKKKK